VNYTAEGWDLLEPSPARRRPVLRDADDEMVLEAAVNGQAIGC
jgi:hypothetical protein